MTDHTLKSTLKRFFTAFINYFLKGLLITLPVFITVSVVRYVINSIDTYFNVGVPVLGFFIGIIGLAVLGYVGTLIITRPLINLMEDLINRIPFVKIIYSSVKDFMEAFVGEKRKFNEAVLVELAPGVSKPGFITQKDLSKLGFPGKVCIYFPHSYAFSGNLFLIDADKVQPFKGNSADVMKFIVSGGVTDF